MTRHSKNATSHSTYTYHEKMKDSLKGGYGSRKRRLGADSGHQFNCCSISLQPSDDLLVSKHGILFDRSAVLEYIIEQKKLIEMRMNQYEKQINEEVESAEKEVSDKKNLTIKKFIESNAVCQVPVEEVNEVERCYWAPSIQTQGKKERLTKPDSTVRCPVSGQPLRYKELFPVQFEKLVGTRGTTDVVYKCPLTGDELNNVTAIVALKPSRAIITEEAYNALVKQDGKSKLLDPITKTELGPKDVVKLKRGATAFSEVAGKELVSKIYTPVMYV